MKSVMFVVKDGKNDMTMAMTSLSPEEIRVIEEIFANHDDDCYSSRGPVEAIKTEVQDTMSWF